MNTFLLILIALIGGGLILFLFKMWGLVNQSLPQEKLEKLNRLDAVAQQMGDLHRLVTDLQSQLGRDSSFQSNLSRVLGEVEKASEEVATLKGERERDLQQFNAQMVDLHQKLSSVYSTLTGRKSGQAGENIVREVLRNFPAERIRSPYYDVEFGLVLFDGRIIPIDSKFAAIELLERYGQVDEDDQKLSLAQQIEQSILRRAKEVSKYIDPNATISVAICAIPDSAHALLRRAHLQAYTDHRVILMPYSMTVPYLLSLYDLHLKSMGRLDESRLAAFIGAVEQAVKSLRDTLENKIKEANTRLSNAYRDCVTAVGAIEVSLAGLRSGRISSTQQESTQQEEVVK